jgi:hypothetical protein
MRQQQLIQSLQASSGEEEDLKTFRQEASNFLQKENANMGGNDAREG